MCNFLLEDSQSAQLVGKVGAVLAKTYAGIMNEQDYAQTYEKGQTQSSRMFARWIAAAQYEKDVVSHPKKEAGLEEIPF